MYVKAATVLSPAASYVCEFHVKNNRQVYFFGSIGFSFSEETYVEANDYTIKVMEDSIADLTPYGKWALDRYTMALVIWRTMNVPFTEEDQQQVLNDERIRVKRVRRQILDLFT